MIPGIDPLGGSVSPVLNDNHPNGGDGTFPNMELYLYQQSENMIKYQNAFGFGYALTADKTGYPTLFTATYKRNTDSFSTGANDLSNLIATIKGETYADEVNVVTHSKGGLVARQYMVGSTSASKTVKRLVMTVPPNTGSLEAKLGAVSFGYVDYSNLYPLWPYFRQLPFQKFIIPGKDNTELKLLNNQPLPTGPQYSIIYSDGLPTPETYTVKLYPGAKSPPVIGVTVGDEVVPYHSQRGIVYDPNNPNAAFELIPAFQSVLIQYVDIVGSHYDYLQLPAVESEVFSELTTDL